MNGMAGRIFRNTFIMGLLTLTMSCVLFTSATFRYLEEQDFLWLEEETQLVEQGLMREGMDYLAALKTDERLTWIAADGTVLFDSAVDAATMENHLDREEVGQALAKGSGRSSHESGTLMEKTLYYAKRLDDGTVLRMSCREGIRADVLQKMTWLLVAVVLLSALLSALMALRAAKKIVDPINELDIENLVADAVYPELQPFADRIREQNRTIRRQMDELRARQQEFNAITDHMQEGFLLADRRLNILSGNPSALELLSGGAAVQSLWEDGCRTEIRQAAEAALDGEHTEVLLPLEGSTYRIVVNAVVSDGQVTGVVVIMMDVTEQQERDALRREFTANVSHELKTPMTAISGFAELMKEGLVPPEKMREFSGDIYRECSRLISLVDDIIDLSKLDEGSVPLEKETVDLWTLAKDRIESLRSTAEKKQVTLSLDGEAAAVFGIPSLLDEMLYNLIDNAIKYNREGGHVQVSLKKGERELRLSVSDTGIGIPKAEQGRVFERFYRVDKSHSRAIGGTGLGLSIVKHAAQYHDARLELESEPGSGSTFTVVFKEYTT